MPKLPFTVCLGNALLLLALAAFSPVSPTATAQQITKTELGIGYYGQTNTNLAGFPNAYRSSYAGPFARFTYNLNRSLALEASGFDSTNLVPIDNKTGGHQQLFLSGIKAGVRRHYLGVFGRLDAGAASFSRALELYQVQNGVILGPPHIYRETHFTLEPGATLEFYPSTRTILRADIDENLNAIFRTVNVIAPDLFQVEGGYVPHHLGASLSVEHRFGHLEDAPTLTPEPERFSIGAYVPLQIREQSLEHNLPALGGGGAWIGFPISRIFSADLVAFDLPHDDHTAGYHDGGTPLSAFAGPKAGFRRGPFGIYAKARPGFTRFSRTLANLTITTTGASSVLTPQYQFSLDTGGVFEYTPARHLILRLEAGDDLIFYHSRTSTYSYPGESGSANLPGTHSSSMLFLAGAGWRF